uniref:Uncharacterized protein n=1 Tax=Ananas comosus var. bracteatus TaxID=296719 RepID=A0A6V7Q533_ANACO|nr:unnamed protein product [Ananas comosus var. bracteatus]
MQRGISGLRRRRQRAAGVGGAADSAVNLTVRHTWRALISLFWLLQRGCSLIRYALVLCFVVLSFYLLLPCEGKDCSRGDAGSCGSLLCFGLRDACADPLSFCFPSTQLGFLAQEDVDPKPNSEVSKESSRTGRSLRNGSRVVRRPLRCPTEALLRALPLVL